jgi:hypothetical protein
VTVADLVSCFCAGTNENCHYCSGSGVRHQSADGQRRPRWPRITAEPVRSLPVKASRSRVPPSPPTHDPAAPVRCRICRVTTTLAEYAGHFCDLHAWPILLREFEEYRGPGRLRCPLCRRRVPYTMSSWGRHATEEHGVTPQWPLATPRLTRPAAPRTAAVGTPRLRPPVQPDPYSQYFLVRCGRCGLVPADPAGNHAGHGAHPLAASVDGRVVCQFCGRLVRFQDVIDHIQHRCSERRKAGQPDVRTSGARPWYGRDGIGPKSPALPRAGRVELVAQSGATHLGRVIGGPLNRPGGGRSYLVKLEAGQFAGRTVIVEQTALRSSQQR